MISQKKWVVDSVGDVSTSSGGSDNEVVATSGDDESSSPLSCALAPPPGFSLQQAGYPKRENHHLLIHEIGPPPGLEAFARPPGLFLPETTTTSRQKQPKRRSKQQSHKPEVPQAPVLREFDQATYRKELSAVLRDLANGTNVAACVQRIRTQNVPKDKQAAEFSDILTRAAEENRGVARRLSFAFAVGLAAGGPNSAFDHEECERGLEFFFLEIFEDLATEVPRLRSKLANELAPTLRTAFSAEQMHKLVPPDCRPVLC